MKKRVCCIILFLLIIASSIFALAGCDKPLGEKIGEVTIAIECKTILENDNWGKVEQGLIDNNIIPKDGIILKETVTAIYNGDTVFSVLKRVCKDKKIHLDSEADPIMKTYYIKGINHIYELSVGESSGWLYSVNGEMPNIASSLYKLTGSEKIIFAYTCEVGDLA